jgi:hypothetical protein
MSSLERIRVLTDWVDNLRAMHRQFAGFTCGDCPQWQSCAAPPLADCPVRQIEIASGAWRERRKRHAMAADPTLYG